MMDLLTALNIAASSTDFVYPPVERAEVVLMLPAEHEEAEVLKHIDLRVFVTKEADAPRGTGYQYEVLLNWEAEDGQHFERMCADSRGGVIDALDDIYNRASGDMGLHLVTEQVWYTAGY